MQTAAHYSASIEILDQVLKDVPAEKALLSWARASRFAGSKDRATIRDIVFDALRHRASYSARFGLSGRGLALGRAYQAGEIALFDGQGFAPTPLSDEETRQSKANIDYHSLAQQYDFPTFLEDELMEEYGDALPSLAKALRMRAPVDLRVNTLKTNTQEAIDFLARDHIFVEALEIPHALRIVHNPRRLAQSRAFSYGYVEVQDISSQMVARFAQAKAGMNVLDYCAGGGGKSLALMMEMQGQGQVDAWDISQPRMKDIPKRAARAGVNIKTMRTHPQGMYDLVFVDAPCSGSGAWRRTPDAKWRLNEKRMKELTNIQAEIFERAKMHVKEGGRLIYCTCSILRRENQTQLDCFLTNNPDFELEETLSLSPLNAGDGFFAARLIRKNTA